MATTGVLNGTNMLLYVKGTAIAGASECDFDLTHSPRETTVKSDAGYATFAEGKRSWKANCKGLRVLPGTGTTFSTLVGLWTSRANVTLKFSTETSGDKFYYGTGIISGVKESDPDNASSTFDVTFDGTGSFTEASHT